MGILKIFSDNAVYIESWGPEYRGVVKISHWFQKWNNHGTVLERSIKQYFHKENQTIVEWYFKNTISNEKVEAFDGISLVEWTQDNKICYLKEFGCNDNRYDPYQNNAEPHFRDEKALWF